MSSWEIPTKINIMGSDWKINSDFRSVLEILKYFDDPEYEPDEKWEICLSILFVEYEPYSEVSFAWKKEAISKAIEFIDMGMMDERKTKPSIVNWKKDFPVIVPSINKVIGKEVRSMDYLHWWTFLGAYMEIGDGLFTQILNVRNKLARGKRLEKWEWDFYKENKFLIEIKTKKEERSQEEKEALRELFGLKGG